MELEISNGPLLQSHPSGLAKLKKQILRVTRRVQWLSVASVASRAERKAGRAAADEVAKPAALGVGRSKRMSRSTRCYPSSMLATILQQKLTTPILMT